MKGYRGRLLGLRLYPLLDSRFAAALGEPNARATKSGLNLLAKTVTSSQTDLTLASEMRHQIGGDISNGVNPMSITVVLPDSLKALLDQQVERLGYPDASAYLSALVQDDLARDPEARLEALLIEGLDSPSTVWDQSAKDALIAESDAILARYADSQPR